VLELVLLAFVLEGDSLSKICLGDTETLEANLLCKKLELERYDLQI
jgi:hypothetical protein